MDMAGSTAWVARAGLTVDVHVRPGDARRALREEVLQGLCRPPKELSPKWLYDERGSQLFDDITRLPEYYPTRREREILDARAAEIARLSGADTLIELGSGTSEKTRLLLDAFQARAAAALRALRRERGLPARRGREARAGVPRLRVHAVVGDFERHLGRLPAGGGGWWPSWAAPSATSSRPQRAHFFRELAAGLEPGDGLLLGTDLLKDRERLFAAYNDSAGVTAEFNRNVLRVLNRELGADFDPEAFDAPGALRRGERLDRDAAHLPAGAGGAAAARSSARAPSTRARCCAPR